MKRTAIFADQTETYRVNPGAIVKGELVLNDGLEEPGLYFKTEGQQLIKIGPCHVGVEEPNSKGVLVSPVTGWLSEKGLSKGELWLEPGDQPKLKIYDGYKWVQVNLQVPYEVNNEVTFKRNVVYTAGVVYEQPVYCLSEGEMQDNRLVPAKYVRELVRGLEKQIEELRELVRLRVNT